MWSYSSTVLMASLFLKLYYTDAFCTVGKLFNRNVGSSMPTPMTTVSLPAFQRNLLVTRGAYGRSVRPLLARFILPKECFQQTATNWFISTSCNLWVRSSVLYNQMSASPEFNIRWHRRWWKDVRHKHHILYQLLDYYLFDTERLLWFISPLILLLVIIVIL